MATGRISATCSIAAPPRPNRQSTGCGNGSATKPSSRASGSRTRMTDRRRRRTNETRSCRRLLAGLGVANLERRELAADGEIVVVEHERARDAVFVELELDRIDRCLFAGLGRLVEITHGDRPALEPGERFLARGGIGRDALVRRNHAPDDGERVVYLLALLRAVVDRKLDDALFFTRGGDDPAHVFGRKHSRGFEIERLLDRLG